MKILADSDGAPLDVRAVVSSFNKKEDKLKALQQFYPGASSTDGTALGEGNFIYTDPDTKEIKFFNPEGLDLGDVFDYGREITNTIGGVVGATVATVGGQAGPQIFTPEEMVTIPAGAALGSELAGQGYDLAMEAALPEAFSISRGNPIEKTIKASENVMGEMVGGKLMQKLLSGASEKGGDLIRSFFSAGAPTSREASKQLVNKAKELNIKLPSGGVARSSPLALFLEQRLLQFPTSTGTIRESFDKFKINLVDAVDKIGAKYGLAVKEGGKIGDLLKKGAEDAATKFRREQGKLYDAAYDLVPDAYGSLTNLATLRTKLMADLSENPDAFAPYMGAAIKKIEAILSKEGVMKLRPLRELRTSIRLEIDPSGQGLIGVTKPQARYLEQVYKALTKDMSEMVANTGGEAAKKAMKKADTYTANRMKFDIEPIINEILKTKQDTQAFSFLMKGTKESGQQLKKIMRNMDERTRGQISASMLYRLGYQKPSGSELYDDFSARTFLTNWKSLADSSKDALFGKGNSARKDLDTIVEFIRKTGEADKFANNSRTGDMIGTVVALSPFLTAGTMAASGNLLEAGLTASGGVASLIPPHYAARLMTSPTFINWITKAGPAMAKNPADTKFHLGRLMEIFSGDQSMTAASLSYINALVPSLIGEAQASDMRSGVLQEPQTPSEIVQFAKSLKPDVKEKIKSLVPTSDAYEVLNNILQERKLKYL
tara:strand:- start:61 stop:2211 length:2151 start_codon:yes stop_codon:yes gene_type:complete